MQLSCPSLERSVTIPLRHARRGVRGGTNLSLPLEWSDVPPATASFVLTIVDLHPIARHWLHWAVVDLPGTATALPEGASMHERQMPSGAIELVNTFGDPGYGGPQPPRGSGSHEYLITLTALSKPSLELTPGATLNEVERAMRGAVLATATLSGRFEQL
jgi:Raf kinase inhibitor-like YbhB/YbcL family protein